jgi:hypothetical protein
MYGCMEIHFIERSLTNSTLAYKRDEESEEAIRRDQKKKKQERF